MKRFLSTLLALALLLCPATAARAASDQGLEEAILLVRSVTDIPDSMTEFTYDAYEWTYAGDQISIWSLSWSDNESGAQIHADVDSLGNLNYFYRYESTERSGLAKITRAEAEKTAQSFAESAVSKLPGELRRVNETEDAAYSYYWKQSYQLYVNDVPVPFVTLAVYVDKYTGHVADYAGLSAGTVVPADFPQGDVIGQAAAKQAYLEKIGVSLQYITRYDYSTKTRSVFPAYVLKNEDGYVIDAKTGELVSPYGTNRYGLSGADGGGAELGSMEADAARSSLSPIEQEAVDQIAELISKADIEAIIREKVPGITKDMTLSGISLQKNSWDGNRYIWYLDFLGASGTVDAKTGEILSFRIYTPAEDGSGQDCSYEEALAVAEAFAGDQAAEKLAGSLVRETESDNADESQYEFKFDRQVNGVSYPDNGFEITVDKASGMILRYSSTWYDGLVFPSIDGAISAGSAFDVFAQLGGFGLSYARTGQGAVSLVYQFEQNGIYYVEPFTGQRLDYDGKIYQETAVRPVYTDLSGHWSEDFVNILADNGYYLSGDRFQPGSVITQLEFLQYLFSTNFVGYGLDEDEFYQFITNWGILTEDEIAPQTALLRQDAAKFLVRFLGFGLVGTYGEIYVNPFNDQIDAEYAGYAALCKALGILRGDTNGNLNGGMAMTRAEAASAIYQTLQVS